MKQLPHVFVYMLFSFFFSRGLHAQIASVTFDGYNKDVYTPTSTINTISASPTNKKINLEWSVPPYSQATTYIIERSLDGENFEIIGSDATAISEVAKKSFSFIDKPGLKNFKANNIFYRVGTLVGNNEYLYSKPLLVRMNKTGNVDFITVLPHPVDNNITMTVGLKENSFFVAQITNDQGQEIMSRKGKLQAGSQEISLAGTNHLLPGTYWLKVIVNGKPSLDLKLLKD